MRIIKNQSLVQHHESNLVKSELSNMAMVIQAPPILVEYFSIDANRSVATYGLGSVEEAIGDNSPMVYDYIDNLPISGIDNLLPQTEFSSEVGHDENFMGSGVIYPNTVVPKAGDHFVIKGQANTALYVVTDTQPVTVRSNPFIQIEFRLRSRDMGTIAQLRRQSAKEYTTTVTAMGIDRSLVIEKTTAITIQEHLGSYIDLCDMYVTLFYDRNKAAFVYPGIYDEESKSRIHLVDMTLWKFMFDEGVIIYDDAITYANNNYSKTIPRVYTGCPDIHLDAHVMNKSIMSRIITRNKKRDFKQYRFPVVTTPSQRITKYQGKTISYIEEYSDAPSASIIKGTYVLWDDEFCARIENNDPYPLVPDHIADPNNHTDILDEVGEIPFNPYLRNVIISWYNDTEIDWDAIIVEDERYMENYILIPMVLWIYKQYLKDLQL